MRKLGNSEVALKPIPGKPEHFEWETEDGKGTIREDRLPRQARKSFSMVVPDLTNVRGTKQWKPKRRRKPCRGSR